jgi:hypothetical protein
MVFCGGSLRKNFCPFIVTSPLNGGYLNEKEKRRNKKEKREIRRKKKKIIEKKKKKVKEKYVKEKEILPSN